MKTLIEEKVNVEKEMKSFERNLKKATSDFSMITFLLTGFLDKDGKANPLKESEQERLDEYFTSFKNTLSNLMTIAASFVIVMQNEPQKEGTFSKVASKQVAEFLEYYELICEYVTDEKIIKKVNDSYGHEAGDKYICDSAEVLTSCFGKENVYRIGGDEFMVIILGETEEYIQKR